MDASQLNEALKLQLKVLNEMECHEVDYPAEFQSSPRNYARLIGLYLLADEYAKAKFCWKRAPPAFKQDLELCAFWAVAKRAFKQDAVGVFAALRNIENPPLIIQPTTGSISNAAQSTGQQVAPTSAQNASGVTSQQQIDGSLIELARLIRARVRAQQISLVERAYVSISVEVLSALTDTPASELSALCTSRGWTMTPADSDQRCFVEVQLTKSDGESQGASSASPGIDIASLSKFVTFLEN